MFGWLLANLKNYLIYEFFYQHYARTSWCTHSRSPGDLAGICAWHCFQSASPLPSWDMSRRHSLPVERQGWFEWKSWSGDTWSPVLASSLPSALISVTSNNCLKLYKQNYHLKVLLIVSLKLILIESWFAWDCAVVFIPMCISHNLAHLQGKFLKDDIYRVFRKWCTWWIFLIGWK